MALVTERPIPIQLCVRCGGAMADIKGSRLAVCRTCGYKDDCC
jgi:ribosomal protein L40E